MRHLPRLPRALPLPGTDGPKNLQIDIVHPIHRNNMFVVHGLRNNAIVHVVDEMPGGGKKREERPKKIESESPSAGWI